MLSNKMALSLHFVYSLCFIIVLCEVTLARSHNNTGKLIYHLRSRLFFLNLKKKNF